MADCVEPHAMCVVFFFVVVVGSSNDATTSFFWTCCPRSPKRDIAKGEGREGGQITVLSFLWRRQGSANHNQAINLSLIRHQMTLKAAWKERVASFSVFVCS